MVPQSMTAIERILEVDPEVTRLKDDLIAQNEASASKESSKKREVSLPNWINPIIVGGILFFLVMTFLAFQDMVITNSIVQQG